jgi:hypothetical protein
MKRRTSRENRLFSDYLSKKLAIRTVQEVAEVTSAAEDVGVLVVLLEQHVLARCRGTSLAIWVGASVSDQSRGCGTVCGWK